MQAGSITCTSQRLALIRCRCSAQEKKPRHRKSKEERRAMVETFVTKFRNTNNGSFPSLNITHKEVGGSYYIVRDIMRDIIQENRVLGPGDLSMQSLTLEDVPVQPEVCEYVDTITGTEVHLEAGNEEDYIDVESPKHGVDLSLEFLENNLLETEGLILDSSNGKSSEKMEVLDYKKDNSNVIVEENCTDNIGKQSTDDVLETGFPQTGDDQGSLMNIITERLHEPIIDPKMGEVEEVSESDSSLPYKEAIKVESFVGPTETSDPNGGFEGSMTVENGYIQKSVVEMRKKTVAESKFHSEEVQAGAESGNISVNKSKKLDSFLGPTDINVGPEVPSVISDLQESVGEMATKTIEKLDSEIKKDGRGQSSESNGKMSINGSMNSPSLKGSAETWDSNGGLELARTVVEVEQFPLPRGNSSLNGGVPDCVSVSSGVEEKKKESAHVKDPVAVITKTEIKPDLEDQNSGKSLDTVPKTEEGEKLDNSTKVKGNREGAKKTRGKAENNPLWNTIQAFVTAFIKFWSE